MSECVYSSWSACRSADLADGWNRSLLVCLTVRLRAMSPKGVRIHPNTPVRATLHIRDSPFPNLSRGGTARMWSISDGMRFSHSKCKRVLATAIRPLALLLREEEVP